MTDSLNKGYKYRIYPNATQEAELDRMLWHLRNVWNGALGLRKIWYKWWKHDHPFTPKDLYHYYANAMRVQQPEYFGAIPDAAMIKQVLDKLDDAYKRFYANLRKGVHPSKAGEPRFKRREQDPLLWIRGRMKLIDPASGKAHTISSTNSEALNTDSPLVQKGYTAKGLILHIGYLSMPAVRMHMHRPLPADFDSIQYATITRDRGKWYIAFALRKKPYTPPDFIPGDAVGIDVGLRYLVSQSDGVQHPHAHWYTDAMPELRRLQRKLDRQRRANNPDNYDDKGRIIPAKVKANGWHTSGNMARTQAQVAKLAESIQNQRGYFWDTLVDDLTKRYSIIAIEDLSAAFMIKNKRLSRLSADAALSSFRLKLEHKARERGVIVVRVRPAFTSQRCSACGHIEKGNRETQSRFVCKACGYTDNADLNAAVNIRDIALAELNAVHDYLIANPTELRALLEAKPRSAAALAKGIARSAGVHHHTTVTQVAAALATGRVQGAA